MDSKRIFTMVSCFVAIMALLGPIKVEASCSADQSKRCLSEVQQLTRNVPDPPTKSYLRSLCSAMRDMWSCLSRNECDVSQLYDVAIERKPGSGRSKSARTQQNIERVSGLICSQDDDPHSHKSPREIERETGIPRSSVRRIVKQDLQLKTYKRVIGQKLNESVKLKRLATQSAAA